MMESSHALKRAQQRFTSKSRMRRYLHWVGGRLSFVSILLRIHILLGCGGDTDIEDPLAPAAMIDYTFANHKLVIAFDGMPHEVEVESYFAFYFHGGELFRKAEPSRYDFDLIGHQLFTDCFPSDRVIIVK